MRKIIKINKKLWFTILTIAGILSIITIPSIMIGIKYNQKRHPDRVPFDLYTPLPSIWYLAGDISIIQDEIFNREYNIYKKYVKDEDLLISFARLSVDNLYNIKEFYEKPTLDLTFELEFNENPAKINIDIPSQLNLSDEQLNTYNPETTNVINALGRKTFRGFSYQVVNLIYKKIKLNQEKNSKLREVNSFLYSIDKDIDKSDGTHNSYRLQVWPSNIIRLDQHSDGSQIEDFAKKLENVYDYMPGTTSSINRGAYLTNDPERNLFIPETSRETFCYAENKHQLPTTNSIELFDEDNNVITDKNAKDQAYHKSLKYLCTPVGDKIFLILVKGNRLRVIPNQDNRDLVWNISESKFKNVITVANYLKDANLAWFDFSNPNETKPSDELVLSIKKEIYEDYHSLHKNRISKNMEWWITWQQAVSNGGHIIPWWVVEDLNIGTKKSFRGQYFEGFMDNTWEKSRTKIINCKMGPIWMCDFDSSFSYNWNTTDRPVNNRYILRTMDLPLERRYQTFNSTDNPVITNKIMDSLKSLLDIGNMFIENSFFKTLSPMINDKFGKEYLDILRILGTLKHNPDDADSSDDISYWNQSIQAIIPYLGNDSGINWYSLFSDKNYETMDGKGIENMRKNEIFSFLSNEPFIGVLKFFVSGKPKEERVNDYLIGVLTNYQGFVPLYNRLHDFTALPAISYANLWEWHSYLDNSFTNSSVNAGLISFLVKYLSIIAYNYKICKNLPLNEKIDNLNQMLWNTYILDDPTIVLKPYYHTKDSNKKSGNLKIEELETQLSIEPFKIWLNEIFGHQVTKDN